MSVSMTWRWGTVFPRKMKPESHWTLAWQKNSLLLFHFRSHFYLLLSHSEKVRGRFLEITICPLFQSNFQSFSLMLYPISLSSSHVKLSWDQGDPSENTSSSPKLPHYHPIKKIATQKTSSHWGLWALIMVWIQCHTLDTALNTYTHTHTHTHTHTRTHAHTHTRTHAHTRTHTVYTFCLTSAELKVHLKHIVQTARVRQTNISIWESALTIYFQQECRFTSFDLVAEMDWKDLLCRAYRNINICPQKQTSWPQLVST